MMTWFNVNCSGIFVNNKYFYLRPNAGDEGSGQFNPGNRPLVLYAYCMLNSFKINIRSHLLPSFDFSVSILLLPSGYYFDYVYPHHVILNNHPNFTLCVNRG